MRRHEGKGIPAIIFETVAFGSERSSSEDPPPARPSRSDIIYLKECTFGQTEVGNQLISECSTSGDGDFKVRVA
jgi:hypothetical protein